MAGSVNKVILVGNLGKDPEIRTTQDGLKIASFSVAAASSKSERNSGERKERTEWHRVAVFNEKLVEIIEKYVKKGSKIYLEGALQTRKWTDNAGQERYTTEVVLARFRGELTMLDSAGGRGGGGGGGYASEDEGMGAAAPREEMAPPSSSRATAGERRPPVQELDDEIPF